jgi:hypothetical protein
MMKRALLTIAGFLALSASLPALSPGDILLEGPLWDRPQSPWASLESQDRFFFNTAFGSMRQTPEYLPVFDPAQSLTAPYLSPAERRNSVDKIVDLRAPDRVQFGGEIGFLYGKSTGKYGREDFAGYVIGTVGNDQFSITAGYYRQESTFNNPRWRR